MDEPMGPSVRPMFRLSLKADDGSGHDDGGGGGGGGSSIPAASTAATVSDDTVDVDVDPTTKNAAPQSSVPPLQVEAQEITLDVDLDQGRVVAVTQLQLLVALGSGDGDDSGGPAFVESITFVCASQCMVQAVTVDDQTARFWRIKGQQPSEQDVDARPGEVAELAVVPEWQPQLVVAFPALVVDSMRRASGQPQFPLMVTIKYNLVEPLSGAFFVKSRPADTAYTQFYTHNHDVPSWTWVPTVRQPGAAFPWSISVVAPQDCFVSCTGEKDSTQDMPERNVRRSTYVVEGGVYNSDELAIIVARNMHVVESEAPFQLILAVPEHLAATMEPLQTQLGGMRKCLQEYLGMPQPIKTCTIAWVAHGPDEIIATSPGLIIMSDALLHGVNEIDEAIHLRRVLPLALTHEWFGSMIYAKSPADGWLINALAVHVARQCHRMLLGQNDVRFQMNADNDRVCMLDVDQDPLQTAPSAAQTLSPRRRELVNLKGPLVVHILERVVGQVHMWESIKQVVKAAIESDGNYSLSTNAFLKILRKTSDKETEVTAVADQFIFKSGCPIFNINYHYNRKRNMVEIKLQQSSTRAHEDVIHPDGTVVNRVPAYMGTLTLRVHETENTYDHVLSIDDYAHEFEFIYKSKAKRLRKPYAINHEETIYDLRPFAEWNVLDEDYLCDSPILWIRADPEFQWIAMINIVQADHHWRHQLFQDHDCIAQIKAVHALRQYPSKLTGLSLLRCVADRRKFHAVRTEAAAALAACTTTELSWLGGKYLFFYFIKRYCLGVVPADPNSSEDKIMTGFTLWADGIPIVKPTAFQSGTEYFVQKGSSVAVAHMRDPFGVAHIDAIRFLLCLLRYNDNDENPFSDQVYTSAIIDALGECFRYATPDGIRSLLQEQAALVRAVFVEVTRLNKRDHAFPTPRRLISAACLRTLTVLQQVELIDLQLGDFVEFSQPSHLDVVRMASIHGMISLGLAIHSILKYIVALALRDPYPSIRVGTIKLLHQAAIDAALKEPVREQFDILSTKVFNDGTQARGIFLDLVKNLRDPIEKTLVAAVLQAIVQNEHGTLEPPRVPKFQQKTVKADPRRKRPAESMPATAAAVPVTPNKEDKAPTPVATSGDDEDDNDDKMSVTPAAVAAAAAPLPAPSLAQPEAKKIKTERPVSLSSLARSSTPAQPAPAPAPAAAAAALPSPSIKLSFKLTPEMPAAAAPPPPPVLMTPTRISFKLPLSFETPSSSSASYDDDGHSSSRSEKKKKKKKKKRKHHSESSDADSAGSAGDD